MRVLTLNLEFGGWYVAAATGRTDYVDEYVRRLRRCRPDVVCLQETVRPPGRRPGGAAARRRDVGRCLAARLGWHHRGRARHGLAVLSPHPRRRARVPGAHRRPVMAVHCAGWWVGNAHLNDEPFTAYSLLGRPYSASTPRRCGVRAAVQLSYATRGPDLECLLAAAPRAGRAVLCGDLNEPSPWDGADAPPWRCGRRLAAAGWVDAAAAAAARAGRAAASPTADVRGQRRERPGNPPLRLDYVYVAPGAGRVRAARALRGWRWRGRWLSDHLPLLVALEP